MSVPVLEFSDESAANITGWRRGLRNTENALLVLALAAAVLLQLIEVVLRKFFHSGIPAQSSFLQHLNLIIGMVGGAIAARDGKLLALSALTSVLPARARAAANIWTGGIAAVVTGLLGVASWDLTIDFQQANEIILVGFPKWWLQIVMPVGFALIAARLLWRAAPSWWGRLIAAGIASLLAWLVLHPVGEIERMVPWALGILLSGTILGAPVFVTLGGAVMILTWGVSPISSVPTTHYGIVTNESLPTIPLFTLAGYFLAEGGASQRLVRVFQAWFGSMRGGPAIITALVCAFFTSFTGGSGVTILALGGLLLPVLLSSGYKERDAIGLLTAAGSLGMLLPPCLPLILYSIVASANAGSGGSAGEAVSMEQMFLGGLVPSIILILLTALWGMRAQPKVSESERPRFDSREAWSSLRDAIWEMLLPVVALLALFGGFATPVEAAAITALYAFMVEVVFHRNTAALRDAPRVMVDCGMLVGGVLLIFGVALSFTKDYLVIEQIPDSLVEWATATIHSKWIFLLGLNVVLLFVGGLIEIYAAIVVVVPLLVPLGAAFGMDPVHLGIMFLANMELGFLAPPIGLNLLLASYRFNKPMVEVMRAVLPMLLVLFLGVLLITYVPALTTWLPGLFGHGAVAR
ncbi:MAG: TRAP transporter large permease subunit [Verrucomicrobia bacterium]|nr:TRAP transporter large permease subunit [Verrucomicrobiota bacterium]